MGEAKIEVHESRGKRLISLASEQCFVAELDASAKKLKEEQIVYDLEPQLLMPAEDMVFDLPAGENSRCVFAIDSSSVLRQFPQEVLSSVIAISPQATLIAQGWMLSLAGPGRLKHTCLLISRDDRADVLFLSGDCIVDWRYCKPEAGLKTAISLIDKQALRDDAPLGDRSIVVIGKPVLEGANQQIPLEIYQKEVECIYVDVPPEELLQLAIDKILTGAELPLINFHNGPLSIVDPWSPSRQYIYCCLAAWVLFGLTLVGGLHYRARTYRDQTEQLVALQQETFTELFPGVKLPAGLMSRLESETRKLRMTRATDQRPNVKSITPIAQAFWQALPAPEQVRFQLQTIDLEPASVKNLRGLVREFGDLDRFRAGLDEHGFELPPISTKNSPQGLAVQWSTVEWAMPNQASSDSKGVGNEE